MYSYNRFKVYGIVQNVGFRYNIKRYCDSKNIKGFVKNLSDFTVEIQFSGKNSVNDLKKFIITNPGGSKVDKIEEMTIQTGKKFDRFKILY